MDCPQSSLAACSNRQIDRAALRSGKFFGLAGARLGFALGERPLLQALAEQLGPWTVNGPVLHVAQECLARPPATAPAARERLLAASQRLEELLRAATAGRRRAAARCSSAWSIPRCAAFARLPGAARHPHPPIQAAGQPAPRPARGNALRQLDATLLGFKRSLLAQLIAGGPDGQGHHLGRRQEEHPGDRAVPLAGPARRRGKCHSSRRTWR